MAFHDRHTVGVQRRPPSRDGLHDKEQDVDLVMCLVSIALMAVFAGFVWAMARL
jgi:hypothetical protein